ncbi:hypothetical protein N9W34_07100, partial [Rickettsiales bacterium]|nr:hypothetical protein [Rickettsiales bacterium]
LTMSLSSCMTLLDNNGYRGALSPKPLFLDGIPDGEDDYSLGFRDGCYNFIGQNGYGFSRMYDRYANTSLIESKLYQQGYRHGDRHCGTYVNKGIIL